MTTPVFPTTLQSKLEEQKIAAVLILDKLEDAVPVSRALLRGGITVMELTLRTPIALDAVKMIRSVVPDMTVGIGTILTPEQVQQAVEVEAAFGVSPGLNPAVVKEAVRLRLPFAPGIATPTDIEAAVALGCRLLKFFPCAPMGGLPYLQSAAAPYKHLDLKYIPLGGVKQENLKDYLSHELVAAVGGSWLAPADLIADKKWGEIEARARAAAETAASL